MLFFLCLQVKESLASEQTRIGSLEHSLNQLSSSVNDGLAEFPVLKEANRKLEQDTHRAVSSFNTLLKDVIRHSDVLEVMLGEEVLDFLELPIKDQKANSILALKEQLGHMQEQLRWHNLSITSLQGNRPGMKHQKEASVQVVTFPYLHTDSSVATSSGICVKLQHGTHVVSSFIS